MQKMTKPEVFITKLAISNGSHEQNLCFGEGLTYVRLQDEAGGYFLEIIQEPSDWNAQQEHCIRLDFEDIDALHKACTMLKLEVEHFERFSKGVKECQ